MTHACLNRYALEWSVLGGNCKNTKKERDSKQYCTKAYVPSSLSIPVVVAHRPISMIIFHWSQEVTPVKSALKEMRLTTGRGTTVRDPKLHVGPNIVNFSSGSYFHSQAYTSIRHILQHQAHTILTPTTSNPIWSFYSTRLIWNQHIINSRAHRCRGCQTPTCLHHQTQG